MRVTNGIPLGRPLLLPVGTVNSVQTLKALAFQKAAKDEEDAYRKARHANKVATTAELQSAVLVSYGARFRLKHTLEDTIEVHTFAPLEALACVWPMAVISGVHCLLPIGTVNCVQTLKAQRRRPSVWVTCFQLQPMGGWGECLGDLLPTPTHGGGVGGFNFILTFSKYS
jgi:hypothetical protein